MFAFGFLYKLYKLIGFYWSGRPPKKEESEIFRVLYDKFFARRTFNVGGMEKI